MVGSEAGSSEEGSVSCSAGKVDCTGGGRKEASGRFSSMDEESESAGWTGFSERGAADFPLKWS